MILNVSVSQSSSSFVSDDLNQGHCVRRMQGHFYFTWKSIVTPSGSPTLLSYSEANIMMSVHVYSGI